MAGSMGMETLRLLLSPMAALVPPDPPQGWLQPGELSRLERQTHDRRRQAYLAGRWLLRQLVGEQPSGHGACIDIDAQGRTVLACGHANVSHSGSWIVAGAGPCPIGVDLEEIRPRRDLAALAAQVHGEDQCAALLALHHQHGEAAALRHFYRLWTLKEAWLKARGQGLSFAVMRQLRFGPAAPDGQADMAVAEVAGFSLAVAVGGALQRHHLPSALADQPVCWELLKSRPLPEP